LKSIFNRSACYFGTPSVSCVRLSICPSVFRLQSIGRFS